MSYSRIQLREHPDYKGYSPEEKALARKNSKSVLEKSEKIKLTLRARYEDEHDRWLREEDKRRARREEEDRKRKVSMINTSRSHTRCYVLYVLGGGGQEASGGSVQVPGGQGEEPGHAA